MTSKQVKRARYKLIEEEVRTYHKQLQALEEERMDVIDGCKVSDGQPTARGIGDPTGNKAVKLVSTMVLLETQRRLSAISNALDIIKRQYPNRYELIELCYFKRGYDNYGLARELHCGITTVKRWRREFIELVAAELGWEV